MAVSDQYAHKRHTPTRALKQASSRRVVPREAARDTGEPAAPTQHALAPPPAVPAATVRGAVEAARPEPSAGAPARRRSRPEIASLRAPKAFVPPSAAAGKPARPSLSEQLAAIRDQGSAILDDLQRTFNVTAGAVDGPLEAALCTLRPRSVRVGSRTCDWPGVLRLYADRAEYLFDHPRHGHVRMLMRYNDMSSLALSRSSRQLRFRIERSLEYFASEYNHFDPAHRLDVTLNSVHDVDELVASAAWPSMQALCASRTATT